MADRRTTLDDLEDRILADRRRQAHKHTDPDCPSLHDADGQCRCEVSGVYCWCVDCGEKFSHQQVQGANGCPACGSKGVPAAAIDDVAIATNWHELRILVMWAERWAAMQDERAKDNPEPPRSWMMPTVRAIATRIQNQHPTRDPLTFAGELAGLRQILPDMEVHGDVQPDDGMLPPKVQ